MDQIPADQAGATGKAGTPASMQTVATVTLAVLAVFYTLYFSAELVLPLVFALVLNLLLQPARRFLHERLKLPATLVALLLLIALFILVAGIATAISVPASGWIAKAPQSLPTLEQRLNFLAGPIDFARRGADQVAHFMRSAPPKGQPSVALQQSSDIGGMGIFLLRGTRAALGQLLTLGVTLFFLLTAGDTLLRRLVEILPSYGEKRRVVEIADEIERNVSGYLVTITVMNVGVGVANGASMWALGMPDPLLWATLAFLLNYIPILGPITGITIFFFVGLFSSPSLLFALLPPGIYLVIHAVEGETVTPMLLARRFTLNPVLVIVSLFFWDFLWGVPGALLAVPLLAIAKIMCDRIPALTALGHMLGADDQTEPKHDAPA